MRLDATHVNGLLGILFGLCMMAWRQFFAGPTIDDLLRAAKADPNTPPANRRFIERAWIIEWLFIIFCAGAMVTVAVNIARS